MLAHHSMRSRHWQQLMSLTNKHLAVGSDSFKLIHLLEAELLECREDVEDIANSAVKELAIETKLKEFDLDWATKSLTFAPFKSRGNIMLNGGATGELMESLEITFAFLQFLGLYSTFSITWPIIWPLFYGLAFFTLDIDMMQWSCISRIKGIPPKPRCDHTVSVADNLLILSGGRGAATTTSSRRRGIQPTPPQTNARGAARGKARCPTPTRAAGRGNLRAPTSRRTRNE